MNIKKSYLIFAFCAVSTIALAYGINPGWFARTFLGVPKLSTDFSHVLRAITGLYMALGCFWLYSAFRPDYRNLAILTTAVFAGGLVAGRLLSIALDGMPSPIFVFYAALELGLVPIALWVRRRAD
jgi:hypothetical protein